MSNPPTAAHRHSFNTMPLEKMSATIDRQFVHGEGAMLARMLLRKGAVVPEHSHSNEQISYIPQGALQFTVAGEQMLVSAGEALVIHPTCRTLRKRWRTRLIWTFSRRSRTGSPGTTPTYAAEFMG